MGPLQIKTQRDYNGRTLGTVAHNLIVMGRYTSAWFDKDGNLYDAEFRDSKWRRYEVRPGTTRWKETQRMWNILAPDGCPPLELW